MNQNIVLINMANKLLEAGSGLATHVTRQARSASMVEENADGDWTKLASVKVFVFDGLALAFDTDTVGTPEMMEIVDTAFRSTDVLHRVWPASIQESGGGYRLQLPGISDDGYAKNDKISCTPAPGLLILTPYDAREEGEDAPNLELVDDLKSIRNDQVGNAPLPSE